MAMPATLPINPAHIKEVISKKDTKKLQPKINLCGPVLGNRSYAQQAINKMNQQQANIDSRLTQEKNASILQQNLQRSPSNAESPDLQATTIQLLPVHFPEMNSGETTSKNIDNPQKSKYNHVQENVMITIQGPQPVTESPSRSLYQNSKIEESTEKQNKSFKASKSVDKKRKIATQKGGLTLTGKTIVENPQSFKQALIQQQPYTNKQSQNPTNRDSLIFNDQTHRSSLQYQGVGSNQQERTPSPLQKQLNESLYQLQQQQIMQQQNNQNMEMAMTNYFSMVEQSQANERVSGYPKPELYNHHCINKYSFPKGLVAQRKPESLRRANQKVSLYDMDVPQIRKGIAGWKLTKRPLLPSYQQDINNKSMVMPPNNQNFENKRQSHQQKNPQYRNQTRQHTANGENGNTYIVEAQNEQSEEDAYKQNYTGHQQQHLYQEDNITNIKVNYQQQDDMYVGSEVEPDQINNDYDSSSRHQN